MVELLRKREVPVPQMEQEAPSVEVRRPMPVERSANREAEPNVVSMNELTNRAVERPQAPIVERDNVIRELEEVLADDLAEVYQALPADKRQAFKDKGEAIARDIRQMIETRKWQGHKILKMLTDWLNLIPNANVYYLRQMSKIKLDSLTNIYESQVQAM